MCMLKVRDGGYVTSAIGGTLRTLFVVFTPFSSPISATVLPGQHHYHRRCTVSSDKRVRPFAPPPPPIVSALWACSLDSSSDSTLFISGYCSSNWTRNEQCNKQRNIRHRLLDTDMLLSVPAVYVIRNFINTFVLIAYAWLFRHLYEWADYLSFQ